jgi:uncharacterized repeat protein (TIGR03803 family)
LPLEKSGRTGLEQHADLPGETADVAQTDSQGNLSADRRSEYLTAEIRPATIGGMNCFKHIVFSILFLVACDRAYGQYDVLHTFTVVPDGHSPEAGLTVSNSVIYGTTSSGGAASAQAGTIFSVNPDGSNYTQLHSFTGLSSDGKFPNYNGLVVSGSNIFGMTFSGGSHGLGTIYDMNTDGSGFTLLHSFSSDSNDGFNPDGDLILVGSTLYGMTSFGGTTSHGTIFKINTDGSGFTILHSFAGGPADGAGPMAGLIMSGSVLYGTTQSGGAANGGTIFKINNDGTGFSLLHSFGITGAIQDGRSPMAALTLSGSMLYGTTYAGGNTGSGTIFQINTDGTGYSLLHVFQTAGQGFIDGAESQTTMALAGSILFGATTGGGSAGYGTSFEINTNGTEYELLHSFTTLATGLVPSGDLVVLGQTLYGTTQYSAPGSGTGNVLYALAVPEPSTLMLASIAAAMVLIALRF